MGKFTEIAREFQKELCRTCEKDTGNKSIDECFKCKHHKSFNALLKELNGR